MSEIKNKIQEDVKAAMRAKDMPRLTTLRGLVSEIKKIEIDTRKDLDEAGVIAVLQKEIKKRRDALEFAENAKREDLISQNKSEIQLIQAYLGEQFSEDKLKEIIGGLIASGADNLGKIMGELNKAHKGKFEGKLASELAKSLLTKS